MSNFPKTKYSYVTKLSNTLSIILGIIIVIYGIYTLDNLLSAIVLGLGLGLALFSFYELIYSKCIKENKDYISGLKVIDFNKYIAVNKYNTPLGILIGLSLAFIGVSVVEGIPGMIILGLGIEIGSNITRIINGAEKNPLF